MPVGPKKRGSVVGALAKSIKKRAAFGGDASTGDEGATNAEGSPTPVRGAKRRLPAAAGKRQPQKASAAAGTPTCAMAVICGWYILLDPCYITKHVPRSLLALQSVKQEHHGVFLQLFCDLCRAAKLEGDRCPALEGATSRARRIHNLWVATHVVSAFACAVMAALRGWRQLQVCLFLLLWAAVCSSALEYAMSCIVHDTMDIHLEAGHTPVRHIRPETPTFHVCARAEVVHMTGPVLAVS